jgi:hypothetical protein
MTDPQTLKEQPLAYLSKVVSPTFEEWIAATLRVAQHPGAHTAWPFARPGILTNG